MKRKFPFSGDKTVPRAQKKRKTNPKNPPPKKPMPSFLLFCKDKRPALLRDVQFKTESGATKVKEVARKLGKMWKALPAKEKGVYVKKSTILRKEYNVLLTKYNDGIQAAALLIRSKPKEETKNSAIGVQPQNNSIQRPPAARSPDTMALIHGNTVPSEYLHIALDPWY